jgi:peptidoglycan/xylan/chitin deacetylase (PgdA/CDA1 family)
MAWLASHGPPVLPLEQVVSDLREGIPIQDPAVVLTFDDGFKCLYENAFPVLKHHQLPATIFLVTGYCGKANEWPGQPAHIPRLPLLDWPQIQEMARHGLTFGAHTVNHPRLDALPAESQKQEFLGSKRAIAQKLGTPPPVFAYPYGAFSQDSLSIARTSFEGACGTRIAQVSNLSDRYALARVDAYYLQAQGLFTSVNKPWFPLYLSARRYLRTLRLANQERTAT